MPHLLTALTLTSLSCLRRRRVALTLGPNCSSLEFDGPEIRSASGDGDNLSHGFISFFYPTPAVFQVCLDLAQFLFYYDPWETAVPSTEMHRQHMHQYHIKVLKCNKKQRCVALVRQDCAGPRGVVSVCCLAQTGFLRLKLSSGQCSGDCMRAKTKMNQDDPPPAVLASSPLLLRFRSL